MTYNALVRKEWVKFIRSHMKKLGYQKVNNDTIKTNITNKMTFRVPGSDFQYVVIGTTIYDNSYILNFNFYFQGFEDKDAEVARNDFSKKFNWFVYTIDSGFFSDDHGKELVKDFVEKFTEFQIKYEEFFKKSPKLFIDSFEQAELYGNDLSLFKKFNVTAIGELTKNHPKFQSELFKRTGDRSFLSKETNELFL